MLVLYNKAHEKLATLAGVADIHLQRVLDGGDEQLTFTYPRSDPWAAELQAEAYVRTDRQEYVIKSTDKKTSAQRVTVAAALNIEGLEGTPIEGGFETVEKTLAECMAVALPGSGWAAVVHGEITKRRTVRIEEDTTAWAVAKSAITTYRVEVEIKALDKTLHFYEQRGQDRGVYFFERLNLRTLGVKSSSYGFFTRLKPIGKDGLHLWIDEKDTLENHQYSQKDITAIWRDERYTNTTSLLEDAQAKLEEASKPILAYTGDIVDLAAQSDRYSLLDYDLGDVVILASESTGERTRQRIVKLDEYPLDHTKDKAEFSNASKTFAQLQKSADEAAKQEAIEVAGRKFTQTLKDGYYTKEETTTAIRALGDEIQLEVSKTFMTKGEGEENAKKAQAAAEAAGAAAATAAKDYTDGQLVNYSTTLQMQSAITQAADGITLEVSKTYATQETVKAAATAAKDYTDGQLVNYSTTLQMQSAITQAADSITLEVSKTYATTSSLDDYTKTSEIRTKFAMSAETVTIETGGMDFKANTISIESDNFKLTKTGYVSATGSFKSAPSRSDNQVLYAVLEGRGIFNYKRFTDEAEGSEVVCVEINTVDMQKKGWFAVRENGNMAASVIAGTGNGVRVYSEGGETAVFYANRGGNGAGYMGTRDGEGHLLFGVGTTDATQSGSFTVYTNYGGTVRAYIQSYYNETGPRFITGDAQGNVQFQVYGSEDRNLIFLDDKNGKAAVSIGATENGGYLAVGKNGLTWTVAEYRDDMRQLFCDKIEAYKDVKAQSLELSFATPFIDFHYGYTTDDYTSRIIESARGVLTLEANVNIGKWLNMPSDYESTMHLHKSKFCPCDGQNALYCNWVSVKGADGNNYWALCGFSYYPGT